MSQQTLKEPTQFESLVDADLPDTLNGWHRLDRDAAEVEYWRSGSSHVSGQYERLSITKTSDGKYKLSEAVYDQFNHLISSTTLIRHQKPEHAGYVWSRMEKRIMEFKGEPEFDGPPSLPETVGAWELVERRHEGENFDAVRWENGEATVTVEEVSVQGGYCTTRREFSIRYTTDGETADLLESIPRTRAFEVAVYIMVQLEKPLRSLSQQREKLQSLIDLGPQRSLSLLRLGVLTVEDLAACVSGSHLCNYHHTNEVQKLVTSRLEKELTARVDTT